MPRWIRTSLGVAATTALVLVSFTASAHPGIIARSAPGVAPSTGQTALEFQPLPQGQSPSKPLPPGATPAMPQGKVAADAATGQPLNVKVEVTIADQTGTTQGFKKTMSVTVADRQSGSIRSRIDVPVPSSTFTPIAAPASASATDKDKESQIRPMVTYSYRSLGLNLDVREITIDGNYIRLRLTLEYSPLDERLADTDPRTATVATAPPGIANFQETLSLVLENGKPLVVAQTSDPVPSRDRKQMVEVKATILK
jgi:hypothetical protein